MVVFCFNFFDLVYLSFVYFFYISWLSGSRLNGFTLHKREYLYIHIFVIFKIKFWSIVLDNLNRSWIFILLYKNKLFYTAVSYIPYNICHIVINRTKFVIKVYRKLKFGNLNSIVTYWCWRMIIQIVQFEKTTIYSVFFQTQLAE